MPLFTEVPNLYLASIVDGCFGDSYGNALCTDFLKTFVNV